jgi:polyphosphate kinase 2 (PPK2 family)
VRVHPEILQAQGLPEEVTNSKTIWKDRFRSIVGMERHLHHNGTRIVKFFLHVSKEEQRQRFLSRLDDPEKRWKFSAADMHERERWDDYQRVYGECIAATTTARSPWYIVPADDKPNARLIVSQAVVEALDGLDMKFPELDANEQSELQALRNQLAASGAKGGKGKKGRKSPERAALSR